MTNYSRIHVFGQGPNYNDILGANSHANAKTKWANENPDKLLTPDELFEAMKRLEENPPEPKKSKPRKRNPKKMDSNVPLKRHRSRGRKGRAKKRTQEKLEKALDNQPPNV